VMHYALQIFHFYDIQLTMAASCTCVKKIIKFLIVSFVHELIYVVSNRTINGKNQV